MTVSSGNDAVITCADGVTVTDTDPNPRSNVNASFPEAASEAKITGILSVCATIVGYSADVISYSSSSAFTVMLYEPSRVAVRIRPSFEESAHTQQIRSASPLGFIRIAVGYPSALCPVSIVATSIWVILS